MICISGELLYSFECDLPDLRAFCHLIEVDYDIRIQSLDTKLPVIVLNEDEQKESLRAGAVEIDLKDYIKQRRKRPDLIFPFTIAQLTEPAVNS